MPARESEPVKITYLGNYPTREAVARPDAHLSHVPVPRQPGLEQLRASILNTPTSLEGINVDALEEGLDTIEATKPLLILEPIFLYRIARQLGAQLKDDHGYTHGFYNKALDMSFVQRNHPLEDLNGPGLIESFAIHEATHSVRPTPTLVERYNPLVRGVTLPPVGSTLAEAHAEYERGQYVLKHDLVKDFTKNVADYGFARAGQVPIHYMHATFDKGNESNPFLAYPAGAIGATVLEILSKHDNGFPELIHKSRQSLTGVSELHGAMNDMMPGLVSDMLKTNAHDSQPILNAVERRFGSAK